MKGYLVALCGSEIRSYTIGVRLHINRSEQLTKQREYPARMLHDRYTCWYHVQLQ